MSSKYQSLFESKFVIVMYKTDPSAEHAISASLNIFGGFSADKNSAAHPAIGCG